MTKPLCTIDFNFGDRLPEAAKPFLPMFLANLKEQLSTSKPIHVAISASIVGDESLRVTVEEIAPQERGVAIPPARAFDEPERLDTGVECVRCGHGEWFHQASAPCCIHHDVDDPCECGGFEVLA